MTNPRKVFIANISRKATILDVQKLFEKYGTMTVFEHKGDFGFVEFDSSQSAEDVIRKFDGVQFLGKRLIVQPYQYSYRRPNPIGRGRGRGRSRRFNKSYHPETRGDYRVLITGIDCTATRHDIQEFGRTAGRSICYTDVYTRDGVREGIMEFTHRDDFEYALKHLDGTKINDIKVHVYDWREVQKRKYANRYQDSKYKTRRIFSRSRSSKRSRSRSLPHSKSPRSRSRRKSPVRTRANRSRERSRDRSRDHERKRERDHEREQRERERERERGERKRREREREHDRSPQQEHSSHERERSPQKERDHSSHGSLERPIKRERSPVKRRSRSASGTRSPKRSHSPNRSLSREQFSSRSPSPKRTTNIHS